MNKKKVAIILLNLGGPDNIDEVEKFLFNLFNDKRIITIPQPFRYLLAKFISKNRSQKTKNIYKMMGGGSTILKETQAQADTLEVILNEKNDDDFQFKTFIAMRYWRPMTDKTAEDVKKFAPDSVILLPLYPQYSTTTTLSSVEEWKKYYNHNSKIVCCYYNNPLYIESYSSLIMEEIKNLQGKKTTILFSAHGLPQKIIDAGDPYQTQIEKTVNEIKKHCNFDGMGIDTIICYQSKVGRLKWLEPNTEDVIMNTTSRAIIVVPISFVSEHSETLVELDIEYKEIAKKRSIEYRRVPTVSTNEIFIKCLASLCMKAISSNDNIINFNDDICNEKMCCKKILKLTSN